MYEYAIVVITQLIMSFRHFLFLNHAAAPPAAHRAHAAEVAAAAAPAPTLAAPPSASWAKEARPAAVAVLVVHAVEAEHVPSHFPALLLTRPLLH